MTSNQSGPKRVLGANTGKRVQTIACGQTSSVAVLDTGEVSMIHFHFQTYFVLFLKHVEDKVKKSENYVNCVF